MFDIQAFTTGTLSQLDQNGFLYEEVHVLKYCVTWICKWGSQLANCRCNEFHGLCNFLADFFQPPSAQLFKCLCKADLSPRCWVSTPGCSISLLIQMGWRSSLPCWILVPLNLWGADGRRKMKGKRRNINPEDVAVLNAESRRSEWV